MLEEYLQLPIEELKKVYRENDFALEGLAIKLYQQRGENLQEFLNFLPEVEKSSSAGALFYYGLHFYTTEPRDLKLACALFEKSADLGHSYSQFCLGVALYYGEGIEQNTQKAIEYLTKSAESNHPQAISTLADIYFNGESIEKDIDKAIELYEKAKEQNICLYFYNLACCYEIKENLQLAIENYQKAYNIAFNIVNSEKFKEIFLPNSLLDSEEDFLFDKPDPFTTLKLRATLFNQLSLMIEYDDLKGIESLIEMQNCPYGNQNYVIGRLYELGINCEPNAKKAIDYYTLASKQGHPASHDRLGEAYEKGIGVEKDLLKAQNYYRLASIGGYERQQYTDEKGAQAYLSISAEKTQKRGLTYSRVKYALLFEQTIPDLLKVAKSSEIIANNEKANLLVSEEFYLKLVQAEFIVAYKYSDGGKYETEQLLLFHLRHPELDPDKSYYNLIESVKTYSHSPDLLKYFNALTLTTDENLIFVNICNCTQVENVVEGMIFYQDKDEEKSRILKERSAKLGHFESIFDLAVEQIEGGNVEEIEKLYWLENKGFIPAINYLIDYFIKNFESNKENYLKKLEYYAERKNIKVLNFLLENKINEKKYLLICLEMVEYRDKKEQFSDRLAQIYHEEYDFVNALKYTRNILHKNVYRLLLGSVDTFTNHDLLLDFYFRFKRILFTRLELKKELLQYKQDFYNENKLAEQAPLICEYLFAYDKIVQEQKIHEIISILTCSLLNEEGLVKRAIDTYKTDYDYAIILLNLAGDYPYAKYNLNLLESKFSHLKIKFFAKNKLKKAMIKLQKSFYPAYLWVNANYPKKAVKPLNTQKFKEELLIKL